MEINEDEEEPQPVRHHPESTRSVIERMSECLWNALEIRNLLRTSRSLERMIPVENRYAAGRRRVFLASEVPAELEDLAYLLGAQGDGSLVGNDRDERATNIVVNVSFAHYLKLAILLLTINTLVFFKLLVWDHLPSFLFLVQ